MSRKIMVEIPREILKQDLEKYRQRAIELGAADAEIITSDMVIVDERVAAKCCYPKCASYGTNANCPPYAMDVERVRKVVDRFRCAIFIRLEVPAEEMAGKDVLRQKLQIPSQIKIHEVVSKIEAEAFYDGYHLALGFAGGSCKQAFCPTDECTALTPGQSCRHPSRARAAMEAVGMDAFSMAAKVGWEIYPIGGALSSEDVPHGNRLGIVLIH
ncbi:DUF2284 domain-containing protein [Chloroflexota bacterium]